MTTYKFVGSYTFDGTPATLEVTLIVNNGQASSFVVTNVSSNPSLTSAIDGVEFVNEFIGYNEFDNLGSNNPSFSFTSAADDNQNGRYTLLINSGDDFFSIDNNNISLSANGSFNSTLFSTAPGVPTGVSGVRANQSQTVTVSWVAPDDDGGSNITSYIVTAYNPDATLFSTTTNVIGTSTDITGLANGTAYTFKVQAVNIVGVSGFSAASAAVTPATVPQSPMTVSGVLGDGKVTVSWAPPTLDGGSAITSYIVTAYGPNGALFSTKTGITGTSTEITGLANGTAYTFKVQAVNIVGESALSKASGAVTPSSGGGGGLICFAEGTRLLTQEGYKAIETLTSDDRLLTTENRSTSLQLTRIHVPCTTKATAPYVVAKGALGENIPSVPLYLSPAHKIAVRDNVWVHASKGATLGLNIKQCPIGKPVTYYHVRCENYARDVILAEGAATESLANLKEDSVTFKKTDKVGVFLRNEYREPTKSLKA